MTSVTRHYRRHFLGSAAGAVGGLLLPSASRLPAATSEEWASTEHFWYRLAPEGPYIDSQRDHKAFGFRAGKVFLSEDCGKTWPHSAEFADAENITFSVILKNGNILFATLAQLFLSTDNLKTHREIIVKKADGSDYVPHTPVNPEQPGWYFHSLDGEHCFDVGGQEMLVWGNYCNVLGGPVPVNIYYSTDHGATVKLAYSFGKNPKFQEKGADTSKWLGNPDNELIARHIHQVTYHAAENAFYACTGDIDRTFGKEVHWLRGTYDAPTDAWDWQIVISVDSNSRFKCGGIHFLEGKCYWIADANGPAIANRYDRGIFKCDPQHITDTTKHTLLFNPMFESANMLIQDGVMLATHCAPASTYACGIIYSPDMGRTWAQYDLKELGPRSGCRIQQKNRDGWFRLDLRKGWIERAEVLFIKPKVG
jgi:hypothetical protein